LHFGCESYGSYKAFSQGNWSDEIDPVWIGVACQFFIAYAMRPAKASIELSSTSKE
jgi:hypothetical protein